MELNTYVFTAIRISSYRVYVLYKTYVVTETGYESRIKVQIYHFATKLCHADTPVYVTQLAVLPARRTHLGNLYLYPN